MYHLTASYPFLREEVVSQRVDPPGAGSLFIENTNLHKLPKRSTGALAVVKHGGVAFLCVVARLDPLRELEFPPLQFSSGKERLV